MRQGEGSSAGKKARKRARPEISRDIVRRQAFSHLKPVKINGVEFPDYVGMADGYVDAVLDGRVLECGFVILACERYRSMRERAEAGNDDYTFDASHVIDACTFVETCDGGEQADGPILLDPFQCFIMANVFGFRVEDERGSYRWFVEAMFDAPRGSGKTALFSRIDLYLFLYEDEKVSQVLIAASSRAQAAKAYRPIQNILKAEQELVEEFTLKVTTKAIRKPDGGFIEIISAYGKKEDGAIPHVVHIDELHAVKHELYEVMTSSFGKRRNELLIQTTTAGANVGGVAYQQRKRLERVLRGQEKAPRFFGIIYTVDEADLKDPLRYENVVKAHPFLGVTLKERTVLDDMEAARFNPGRKGEFLAKRLNVYAKGATHAIAPAEWIACENQSLKLETFKGRQAYIGVDLSSHDDMTAIAILFDGEKLACFAEYFIPETAPVFDDETISDDMLSWVAEKRVTVTDKPIVDYAVVQARLEELCVIFDVQAVVFDRAQSIQMAGSLMDKGIKAGIIAASSVEMNEPTRDLITRARNNMLQHDGNPVLTWNAVNVVITGGVHAELWKPSKDRTQPQRKIDGFSALCHANVARLGRVKTKLPDAPKPVFNPNRVVREY